MQILCALAQPSRHFVLVGCPNVVKCKFLSLKGNPFVTSCWSDVRNCGKTMIFICRGRLPTPCAHFIHFCARRCSETYILKFWMARRCSETHILILPDEPSRRIRWVDRAKLWRNANFGGLKLLRALSWACERLCFVSARELCALYLLSQSFEYGQPRKFVARIGRWPWKRGAPGSIPGSGGACCVVLSRSVWCFVVWNSIV